MEQKNGEYYWERYMDWVKDENGEYNEDYVIEVINKDNFCFTEDTILCRAFTLGELVRELPECRIEKFTDKLGVVFTAQIVMHPLIYESRISPEEAAGELLAEIKSQEKQKEG